MMYSHVGGLDAGCDVQATTSAAVVIGNDLDHEYPVREIIQKIKKNTYKQSGGTVGKFFYSLTTTCISTYAVNSSCFIPV
jgi:hypothetical protein